MKEQTGRFVLQKQRGARIYWLGGLLKEIIEPLSRSALVFEGTTSSVSDTLQFVVNYAPVNSRQTEVYRT
jgi:hypothetical protein